MTINFQRWTPPCGCSFEQSVDTETGKVELFFAHEVCGGHEHIAKTALATKDKALTDPKFKDMRKEQIIRQKVAKWQDNLKKNLEQFENHPDTQRMKRIMSRGGKDGELIRDHYNNLKSRIISQVNDFTDSKKTDMLIGLECDYALDAEEVYDHICNHPEEQNNIAEGNV